MPVVDRRGRVIRYLTTEGALPYVKPGDGYDTGWPLGGRGGLLLPAPFAQGQVTGRLGLGDAHKEWLRSPDGQHQRVLFIVEKNRAMSNDDILVVLTARKFAELTASVYEKEGAP